MAVTKAASSRRPNPMAESSSRHSGCSMVAAAVPQPRSHPRRTRLSMIGLAASLLFLAAERPADARRQCFVSLWHHHARLRSPQQPRAPASARPAPQAIAAWILAPPPARGMRQEGGVPAVAGVSQLRDSVRGFAPLLVVLVLVATAVVAPPALAEEEKPTLEPAADLLAQMPQLSDMEIRRRRTSLPTKVEQESWFKDGQRTFNNKCIKCHLGPSTKYYPQKGLTLDDLKRNGYNTDKQIQYIIRYGRNRMPGFAFDCEDSGNINQCRGSTFLSEEKLQNVQDYIMNAATHNWKFE